MPGLDAGAAAGRNPQHHAAGIDLLDVILDPLHLHRQIGQQIGLGDQHTIGLPEHHRVLEGLVVALGDAEQGHFAVFTHLEFGRTNKVADVFSPEQIEAGGIKALPQQSQAAGHHGGIKVAGAAGGNRHHGHPHRLQTLGVELGGHVTLQHGHGEVVG